MFRRSIVTCFVEDGKGNLTDLGTLFFQSAMCCPASQFYGVPCDKFRLSTMRRFDEKIWQLRTLQFRNKHYVVPFIVNSGGVKNFCPIVSYQMLSKIGAIPAGEKLFINDPDKGNRVTMPSPLGELGNFTHWDTPHEDLIPQDDVRYNLFGHDFANFTVMVDYSARLVAIDKELDFKTAVDLLIKNCPKEKGVQNYIQNPANRHRVERELQAYIDALNEKDASFDELAKRWASMKTATTNK